MAAQCEEQEAGEAAERESVWPQFLAEIFARISERIDSAIRKHEAEYHGREDGTGD